MIFRSVHLVTHEELEFVLVCILCWYIIYLNRGGHPTSNTSLHLFVDRLVGVRTYVSVNGEKQDGGFDDVEGEVFPCAGSYRSGVTIRLLKVWFVWWLWLHQLPAGTA